MDRIALNQVSTRRIYDAVLRRLRDIPHALAWSAGLPPAGMNRSRLSALRGRHSDDRCFIMGNGPSLATMDLTPLQGEITFGLNRIYLLFDKLPFEPSYLVCINELVLEQFASEIDALRMTKFVNWNSRARFEAESLNTLFLRLGLGLSDVFQTDLTRPLSSGGTVTYAAMQVAYFMGFREVILIGVDHNFVSVGPPNRTEVRTGERDLDHFHPAYFPKGSRWQLPDLLRSEAAYGLARKAYEADGRRILDATVGGKCPVFERCDFATLF